MSTGKVPLISMVQDVTVELFRPNPESMVMDKCVPEVASTWHGKRLFGNAMQLLCCNLRVNEPVALQAS